MLGPHDGTGTRSLDPRRQGPFRRDAEWSLSVPQTEQALVTDLAHIPVVNELTLGPPAGLLLASCQPLGLRVSQLWAVTQSRASEPPQKPHAAVAAGERREACPAQATSRPPWPWCQLGQQLS